MKKQVIKSDYNRVLLTEVQPYELPFIISNEGFYNQMVNFSSKGEFESELITKVFKRLFFNFESSVVPFEYEIVKNSTATRSLSLFHPSTQNEIVSLYKQFSPLIIENCKKSENSLRAPTAYASTYYIPDKSIKLDGEKIRSPETKQNTYFSQYASSFFTYSKFSFMNSFYDSKMFINLEAKYNKLRKLDISNCFGSIYTHSLSWALKPKSLVKEIISDGAPKSGLDSFFDKLMQKSNLNETNGILVGSEVSRIFSELILQKIDLLVLDDLKNNNVIYGAGIEFYRYMDDYFIFFNDQQAANVFELVLSRRLREFKLSLNESKKETFDKPFITPKTRAEVEIQDFIKARLDNLLESCKKSSINRWVGRGAYTNFMKRIRVLIVSTHVSYQDASKAVLKEIQSFVHKNLPKKLDEDEFSHKNFASFIKFLIETSFYLYSNDKRYATSYSLSLITFNICKLMRGWGPDFDDDYEITSFISKFITKYISHENVKDYNLETCNFILLLSETPRAYDIRFDELDSIIRSPELNYFLIVSLLYYFRDIKKYQSLKDRLCRRVCSFMLGKNEKDSRHRLYKSKTNESELVHLLCDFISCPFVDKKYKDRALTEFIEPCIDSKLDTNDKNQIIEHFNTGSWFVNWNEIDFNVYLQKKRLNSTY